MREEQLHRFGGENDSGFRAKNFNLTPSPDPEPNPELGGSPQPLRFWSLMQGTKDKEGFVRVWGLFRSLFKA